MHVPTSLISRLREGKAGAGRAPDAPTGAASRVYTAEEVLDVAARGNVVLRGWGATCLLRPVPHVVCVRVTRPFAQRVAWLHGAASAPTTPASPKTRSGAATAPTRRACTRSSASPGATRCSTTSSSTPTGLGRELRRSRSLRSPGARNSPRPTPRARCSQDLALEARVRAALRADEATRDVDVTVDERRRPRRPHAASSLNADEMPAAERVAARGAGRERASTTSCA